jgi:hypothetical protein
VSKTKFVEYGNRGLRAHGVIPLGFWAYDVALNVFLKYLIDAAEASDQANTEWLSTAIADWRLACVPDYGLTLDANWSTEQRQAFLALAEEACTRLAERESIPAEEIVSWPILDDIRIFTRGAMEVYTAPIVELGRAIIALVRGELPEAPEGQIWLYGAPGGRLTIGWEGSKAVKSANSLPSDDNKNRNIFSLLSTVRAFFRRLRR